MSRTLEEILTDVYNGLGAGLTPNEQTAVLMALGPSGAAPYGIYPTAENQTPPTTRPAPVKAPTKPKGGKQ